MLKRFNKITVILSAIATACAVLIRVIFWVQSVGDNAVAAAKQHADDNFLVVNDTLKSIDGKLDAMSAMQRSTEKKVSYIEGTLRIQSNN